MNLKMKYFVIVTTILVAVCSAEEYVFNNSRIEEDALLTAPELIEKYGYPVEVHQVETEDGYILEVHRIPYGRAPGAGPAKNKTVVFVQHGILSSSADWIIAGPGKGLGYMLADFGYDVWMGNARGNTYSKKHKTLNPKRASFWDFSWHEIGTIDLPAMIDYALDKTGEDRLFYIGHSQGTTAFFVMCSEKPEYNQKIRAQISLAPIAFMNHLFSPMLRILSYLEGPFTSFLLKLIGINEFFPTSGFLAFVGDKFCSESSLTQFMCTNTIFVLCGFNLEQMNTELLPVIMGHSPAGASTKQFRHYAQLIRLIVGKFRKFDYGVMNFMKYKRLSPPSYRLDRISAPVALFYSHNDWLAAERDVLKLYDKLPNTIGRYLVTDEKFNHLDYLWAKDVDTLVYNRVLSLLTTL